MISSVLHLYGNLHFSRFVKKRAQWIHWNTVIFCGKTRKTPIQFSTHIQAGQIEEFELQ